MQCSEYRDIVAPHVDGALSAAELEAAAAHVRGCRECRRVFSWELAAKDALRPRLTALAATPLLRAKIEARLKNRRLGRRFSLPGGAHGLAAAVAALALLVAPYFLWRDRVSDALLTEAVSRYEILTSGKNQTSAVYDGETARAQLLDLTTLGYRLLARATSQVTGWNEETSLYEGEGRKYILAQELEADSFWSRWIMSTQRLSGSDFVSYSKKGVNLVAWGEKGVLCIIASELPAEALLGLARQVRTAG
jgi:anti-sigma factor RsiW